MGAEPAIVPRHRRAQAQARARAAYVVKVRQHRGEPPAPRPPSVEPRVPSTPKEAALLVALGFDPKTHDCMPVTGGTHDGVQVLKDGVRVRFFTRRQVRKLAGAWKTALRAGAA